MSWRTKSERLVPKGRGLVAPIHRAAEKAHSRKLGVATEVLGRRRDGRRRPTALSYAPVVECMAHELRGNAANSYS